MTWRPGRGFRVGTMRERVTVQSGTAAVDSVGQSVLTWTALYTDEPAMFEPVTGGETLRGKQVDAGVTAIFTVHYRSTYTPEMRLVHESTTYGIVYAKPVEGGRRYTELHCKA